jgi:YVTN family beta-propeller protein
MFKKTALAASLTASVALFASAAQAAKPLSFDPLWTVSNSGSEIGAYDDVNHRVYTTNPEDDTLNVVDAKTGENLMSVALSGAPNSVVFCGAACGGAYVAVAVEGASKQDNGRVQFFDATTGQSLGYVETGALPDMLTVTPDGKKILVANEGEPNDEYTNDPVGSITIIDVARYMEEGSAGVSSKTLSFADFDDQHMALVRAGVRIFGPGSSVGQDIEPEYITVAEDSKTAWVALQENNALAVIDLEEDRIKAIHALGTKNHMARRNTLDASNKDDIDGNLQRWPVMGMYMPDAIANVRYHGTDFVITTNEGDARDYDGYSEEARVKDLTLDPWAFPDAEELQKDENLGRLKTTLSMGDLDADGDFDEIYSYGARSFSIWGPAGQVWDSGNQFAKIVLRDFPEAFEDGRSDDKGGEPEAVVVGEVAEHQIAFIGLERYSVVLAYDVSNPYCPRYVGGVHNEGDVSPEGLIFVGADTSYNGENLDRLPVWRNTH